jgi:hypothetical protein
LAAEVFGWGSLAQSLVQSHTKGRFRFEPFFPSFLRFLLDTTLRFACGRFGRTVVYGTTTRVSATEQSQKVIVLAVKPYSWFRMDDETTIAVPT